MEKLIKHANGQWQLIEENLEKMEPMTVPPSGNDGAWKPKKPAMPTVRHPRPADYSAPPKQQPNVSDYRRPMNREEKVKKLKELALRRKMSSGQGGVA